MLKRDLDELKKPYIQDGAPIDNKFGDALGLPLASARKLKAQIFDDLDESKLGIGWWVQKSPLTSKQRIIVSDHLYKCVGSIETNLIETKLQLLLVRGEHAQQRSFFASRSSIDLTQTPILKLPKRDCAMDDLHDRLLQLHIAGFFRAFGSTLDCLGCSIVGVLALPRDIIKSDFSTAIESLEKISGNTTGEELQKSFRESLSSQTLKLGPKGWLNWAKDFRNMLVHRGRRLIVNNVILGT